MRIVVVSGIPGAGKTTVARALAAGFDRSVHLEGDVIGEHFIVNGLVAPQGPPIDEAEAQLALRRTNMCLLADSYSDGGFMVVIDDVVVSSSVLDSSGGNCGVGRCNWSSSSRRSMLSSAVMEGATSMYSSCGGTSTLSCARRCRGSDCGSTRQT